MEKGFHYSSYQKYSHRFRLQSQTRDGFATGKALRVGAPRHGSLAGPPHLPRARLPASSTHPGCAPRPAPRRGACRRAARTAALTARSGWPLSRWDTARMTPARQPLPQPLCPRSGRASSPAATHRNRFPTSSGRVSTAMAASTPGTSAARSYWPPMPRSRPQATRPASESAPARSGTRSRAGPVLSRAPQAN